MIKIDIRVRIDYTRDDIIDAVAKDYPIKREELRSFTILRKTLKLDGECAEYALCLALSLGEDRERGLLKMKKRVCTAPVYDFKPKERVFSERPLVIGAGPAGLFCALALAEGGASPIVIERGLPVGERMKSVSRFFTSSTLDTESNIQFGEGGAGAFSDGKLKVGSMDGVKHFVLSEFVRAGADEDILYTVGAHLGTDKLPSIVERIRERIISLGGEFHYSARLVDILCRDGSVTAAVIEKDGKREIFDTGTLFLATGHSARDVFAMLFEKGIPMQSRPFGIGMRIEHKREYINSLVYGKNDIADTVGTASYHLVTHLPSGRSVYSFCMCPGGTVVAAASEQGGVVTNGMSEYSRGADNSNAALLVSVDPSDFGSDSVLAGLELQRRIECATFRAAGESFAAPVTTLSGFMSGVAEAPRSVLPSYPCGTETVLPDTYLPSFITDSLRAGLTDFDAWMPGFITPDAVLTGSETRSTSPIRVLRDASGECPTVKGLYPIGEGAGYAGGIVSSAVDGVRIAELAKANI